MTRQGIRRIQLLPLIVLILALLVFANVKAGAQTRDRTVTPPATAETHKKDGSPIYYCDAPTKAGGKCRRHVKNQGDRCFMHTGK